MPRRFLPHAAALIGIALASGCASNPPPAPQPIPPESPFAKVHVGEEMNEVYAAIGAPDSVKTKEFNLAWVPLRYSGNDDVRELAHYKSVGRITFSNDVNATSGFSVQSIDYDRSEPGY
jgi:hypothetical protein